MFKPISLILFAYFICHTIVLVFCQNRPVVKFVNVICDPINPKYIVNYTCKIQAKSWDLGYAFMEATLLRDLKNITAKTVLYKYYTQFRPYLINVTVNYCDIMSGRFSSYYAYIFTKDLKNKSNILHPCPIVKGKIYAKDYYFKSDTKIPLPVGIFKLNTTFYEGYPLELIGSNTYFANVYYKNGH